MAAIESAFAIFACFPSTYPKPLPSIKINPTLEISPKKPLHHLFTSVFSTKKQSFIVQSTPEDVATLQQNNEKQLQKRKLFVLNLPWTYTVADVNNFFAQCGTVSHVEIIKHKDGKNRGFAFVTMATGEEAQAAIDKFNASELSGRTIRVELAKKFKKPRPIRSPPLASTPGETRHKLYVSNLAWKTRSTNLREFFSDFSPISARVVFDSPSGNSAGYGFVSFSTKEEAVSAMSSLDGKELMGRPICLKFSKQNVEGEPESVSEGITEEQSAES
ncbi:RNA splicing factor [Lithospermum erythrorhizon]|uniref:RNA splicing factor n=1 Tax=Lithospermum erythrorhizon TaxID=34254 RepID=A0AAV3R066_LITER